MVAIGAPLGLENSLTDGLISAVRNFGAVRVFQTSTPISSGSSGGPLFNDYGEVVGLTVSSLKEGQLLNFAIPINYVKRLLATERPISFAEMLARTRVQSVVIQDTFSVLPGREVLVRFGVPTQGGQLEASFSVSGGLGNDVRVGLYSVSKAGHRDHVVWPSRTVKQYGRISMQLGRGTYEMVFNNGTALLSSKSVAASAYLMYFR